MVKKAVVEDVSGKKEDGRWKMEDGRCSIEDPIIINSAYRSPQGNSRKIRFIQM